MSHDSHQWAADARPQEGDHHAPITGDTQYGANGPWSYGDGAHRQWPVHDAYSPSAGGPTGPAAGHPDHAHAERAGVSAQEITHTWAARDARQEKNVADHGDLLREQATATLIGAFAESAMGLGHSLLWSALVGLLCVTWGGLLVGVLLLLLSSAR